MTQNQVPEAIASWLEQKRSRDRVSAAAISILALGSGTALFIIMSLVIYGFLSIFFGPFVRPVAWLGPVALGLASWIFFRYMKRREDEQQLGLDPTGIWILKDICSVGPRLILEGMRQVRCRGVLGELDVNSCAQALAYLAGQNAAVGWQELTLHSPNLAGSRLREQLLLMDGVLFLGDETDRVTLMDPFRLRLRWMLGQGQKTTFGPKPPPEPAPQVFPVNEPEKLGAYEILGVPASASFPQIKAAYRRRVKECHPDLFAGMDQQAKALAERWTKALNTAYATLKPRSGSANYRDVG